MDTTTTSPTTRAKHLRWAKDRALAYLNDPAQALASFASDLGKHDDTRPAAGVVGELGMMLLMSGNLERPDQVCDFIEGTN